MYWLPRKTQMVFALTVVSCCAVTFASKHTPHQPTAEADFVEAASKLRFFAWDDFLYDRAPFRIPQDEAEEYLRILRHAIPNAHGEELFVYQLPPLDEHERLLHHSDAKVRTLALAALVQRNDPQVLPMIAMLLDDGAPTFGKPMILANTPRVGLPPLQEMTVGNVAQSILGFYGVNQQPSGGEYGRVRPGTANEQFVAYWNERATRRHCLGWWNVQIMRAASGRWPPSDAARIRIENVVHRIRRLSPTDRDIAMLALLTNDYDRVIYEDKKELIYAGRRLGPEHLFDLILGRPVIDDPDLPLFRARIERFILDNAAELLRPTQVPALLDHGRLTQRAQPFVAAAHLDPPNARQHLQEGFQVVPSKPWTDRDQVMLAVAMLECSGSDEADFLSNWFFDQELRQGSAPARAMFVERITDRFSAHDRTFLKLIVSDDRFDTIDWTTLKQLINGLNNNCPDPIVTYDELQKLHHPTGQSHFDHFVKSGSTEYAEHTQTVLTTLVEWRQRVRDTVDCWGPER